MGRSAGYDRNLICNPLLSLAVCPGFSLDEKVRGEVVSIVLLIRVRLDVAETTKPKKGNPQAKSKNRSNA